LTKKLIPKDDTLSRMTTSNEIFQLELNEKIWTSGPQRFAQIPSWAERGLSRPPSKFGLEKTMNSKQTKKLSSFRFDQKENKIKPYKSLTIFPSIDPYSPQLRAQLRLLMEENPWIIEGNEILQQLIISKSTRSLVPRQEEDLPEGTLDKWKNGTKLLIPLLKQEMTPAQLESWLDNYFKKLDLDSLVFDIFLFVQEQGRSCIGMFPAERKANGKFPLPQGFKIIRPEFLRRPIKDFDTDELAAVEVTSYTGNGSLLDAKRCVYFNLSKNLQAFADFYGKSAIRDLVDVGLTQLQIYGIDWKQATITTWHQSPIFKHTFPSKNWSEVKTLMDDFNQAMEGSLNKVVSISNNVELLNPNGTDSGDIAGLNSIEERAFEVIAGRLGIPKYMFSRGKEGNMGGNSNREEIEAFLNTKVKPKQELFEHIIEDQCYDKILAILFEIEPEHVGELPIKLLHNFEKPNISTPITLDEWNIWMSLVDRNITTMEQVMEHFGLRNMMVENSPTMGTDTTPTQKVFNPFEKTHHPTWENKPTGRYPNDSLNKNSQIFPHSTIGDLTKNKTELLKAIKSKISADTKSDKHKAKLEREFQTKHDKLAKDKTTWETKRENEFLAKKM